MKAIKIFVSLLLLAMLFTACEEKGRIEVLTPMAQGEENTETRRIVEALPQDEPPDPDAVVLWIVNRNSKKFHRSGACSYVSAMSGENRTDIMTSAKEMLARGYEPCTRCAKEYANE